MVSFRITIIAIYLKAYVILRMNANGAEMAPKMRGFFSPFSTMGPKMLWQFKEKLYRQHMNQNFIAKFIIKDLWLQAPLHMFIFFYLLRSECFLCEFLSSFLTRLDLECNFWKIVLKSCSWNRVSRMPSSITIPSLLFKTGCWSMSKSIVIPDLEVSEPITLRRSSEKLENKAALATMRVRILVFSSLGCLAAAGYLQKG